MSQPRYIRNIFLDHKGKVKIQFNTDSEVEYGDPDNDDEEGSATPQNEMVITSHNPPHEDFKNAFKELRKLALEIVDIEKGQKLQDWNICQVKIQGNFEMQQARAVMTLTKFVRVSQKYCKMELPQLTLYPSAEDKLKFPFADKLAPMIEKLVKEAWLYTEGKYEESAGAQLPLFIFNPKNKKAA